MQEGNRLSTDLSSQANQKAEGYCTPEQDRALQVACFAPRRVLPIIFLPGIMGSNLKITNAERQKLLKQKDNIAWRPDAIGGGNAGDLANADTAERQLRLDPATTAVDMYDPAGPADLSGDRRHGNVELGKDFDSPLLRDDPPTKKDRRTAAQKGRRRGWGEVFFKSYGPLLQMLECRMNNIFTNGQLHPEWREVVGADPKQWMADEKLAQQPLTEEDLKNATAGCFFPVYALGYNWLESSVVNARSIAARTTAIVASFQKSGFECEKVILVTHSMGGLLARAVIHPHIGKLEDGVLGIVHGVQPATGAGAAYKRMRAGFEDEGVMHASVEKVTASITSKILGNFGDEVTAVLANAPGGLELLPGKAYGNGWLQVTHNTRQLAAWPKNGDPYEEIYKTRGKWYSLLREEWINPSDLSGDEGGGSFDRTARYLDDARKFHDTIAGYYHPNSYAHYGADKARAAFGNVVWKISQHCVEPSGWENWPITGDTRQGVLELVRWREGAATNTAFKVPLNKAAIPRPINARIEPPTEAGDQTVPVRSADDQFRSGCFKAVFRQAGYEHQASYKDARALASTLYSIVRIAQQARWRDGA